LTRGVLEPLKRWLGHSIIRITFSFTSTKELHFDGGVLCFHFHFILAFGFCFPLSSHFRFELSPSENGRKRKRTRRIQLQQRSRRAQRTGEGPDAQETERDLSRRQYYACKGTDDR
ncbi:unnamed protein product, partial [Vitis vinifera]